MLHLHFRVGAQSIFFENAAPKGQWISKGKNLVFPNPQKPAKIFTFFTLASKKPKEVVETKDESIRILIWYYLE